MRQRRAEQKQTRNTAAKSARRKRTIRGILLGGSLLLGSFLLFGAVYVLGLDAWHEFDAERILGAPQSLSVYDAAGEEVSCLYGAQKIIRIPVSLAQIPQYVRNAFLAAEDVRFYEHIGVDFIRILGAAWEDIKAGSYVQGASTISQQLVKLSHLSSEKVMTRKLEEAVLAYQMEQQFSKDEILTMYLNYVYFGGGYYGIEAAARGYFGVPASQLTLAQGAQLAGILKAPSRYAPHLNMDNSIARRNHILGLMQECGFIGVAQRDAARAEEVTLVNSIPEDVRGYYVDLALQQACEVLSISMNELLTGGYRIKTAMDSELQAQVEAMLQDQAMFPQEAQDVQAALVVVNARTGGVAALMGGRENTTALAYNRAVHIRRQPGSVIKPIIAYAPALEEAGYTTVSMLLDEPTDFNGYQPENYNTKYYGWVTLREAVQHSLNVPAVKVFSEIGVNAGKDFAQRLGILFDERDDSLALALGGFTYGVSPYQIAGAYAAFASGGEYSTPSLLLQIENANGETLYTYRPERERVMSDGNAYILTSMLKSAVETGTGRRINHLGIELAAKTGTTGFSGGGNRDAWMAAYNPEYAVAVWMGYDDDSQGKALPDRATGGTYPAMLVGNVFEELYTNKQAPAFSMPDSVREYRLDQHTLDHSHMAVLANGLTPADSVVQEVFVIGTEPTDMSRYWVVPMPPSVIRAQIGEDGRPQIHFVPMDTFIQYRLYREDEGGNVVMLGEWTGSEGSITCSDSSLQATGRFQYYVIPVHPRLQIAGNPVVGAASRRVEVEISALPSSPSTTLRDALGHKTEEQSLFAVPR